MGGTGEIPWSSIDRYAQRYGIASLDSYERFMRFVRAMDRMYLQHANERAQARSEAAKKRKPPAKSAPKPARRRA